MFKFLRQYQFQILAVGVSLLMLAFLIQGSMSLFTPKRENVVIGHTPTKKITYGDLDAASSDIYLLERLRFLPIPLEKNDSLAWLLALQDAKATGLDASDLEINQLLSFLNLTGPQLQHFLQSHKISQTTLRQTIRHWLLIQEYIDLIQGRNTRPPVARLQDAIQAQMLQNQIIKDYSSSLLDPSKLDPAQRSQLQQQITQVRQLQAAAAFSPRLSDGLIQQFIFDQGARIRISALAVPAQQYLEKISQPDDSLVKELFEKYRHNLPGTSQPYGFGYRTPDRVKLEYLSIPFDRLQSSIKIQETQALEYYEKNQSQFVDSSALAPISTNTNQPAAPIIQPYRQVRTRVLADLRREKARELGDRILKEAQALLIDNARQLPESLGYRQLPPDWKPLSLADIAQTIQQRTGILPDVISLNSQWLDTKSLSQLPGLGLSHLALNNKESRQTPPSFTDYVLSARELKPATDNTLTTLRLQTLLPSLPLTDDAGNRYLFRLTDAQPQSDPADLSQVLPQVQADARLLSAYRLLLSDKALWESKLATASSLDALAGELHQNIQVSTLFTRRILQNDTLKVPAIPGFPTDQQFHDASFVDALFDRASDLSQINANLSRLPLPQRAFALPVESRLALYLTIIDEFKPLSQREYQQIIATTPQIPSLLLQVFSQSDKHHPLSIDQLKLRTGFTPERASASSTEEKADDASAPTNS